MDYNVFMVIMQTYGTRIKRTIQLMSTVFVNINTSESGYH